MKEQYIDKNFHSKTLTVIEQANEILNDYAGQGYALTLRQLYYQFVSRDLIENSQRSYKRLGSIINDGRLAGLIDWDHIEDRTRNHKSNPHWTEPSDIIKSSAEQYHINLWNEQEYYVELWIEKDALIGIIEPTCKEWDIIYMSCRGYSSQSEMWRASRRLQREEDHYKKSVIIQLSDHDPSGIDMSRDIEDRMNMFGVFPEVRRIALNMDQIEEYNPPPNPAKLSDSRAESYVEKFGYQSWELDALEPRVLNGLIEESIAEFVDLEKFKEMEKLQERQRTDLIKVSNKWDSIVESLNS